MGRDKRKELIQEIEELRGSRVLTYVTSDRVPAGGQMSNDAVRQIYDHLRGMGEVEKLDFFIYSRGGDIDVPWRIANALRTTGAGWNVLVPLAANSAATLLALGADEIVLGPQGELGPIDPQMTVQRGGDQPIQDTIGVEDVMSYVKFVTERAGLSDQAALGMAVSKLAERMDPVSLGRIYRTHSHIREVAGQMLRSRAKPPNEQTMGTIIETLAERVYAHGHAIGYRDAEAIGLPVTAADASLDSSMWALLNEYEAEMRVMEPLDPRMAISNGDLYEEEASVAAIESTWGVHKFGGTLEVRARRQMPPNLAVNMNMNLQLPDLPDPMPPDLQQLLQAMMQGLQQQIAESANQAVQESLQKQAPLAGIEAVLKGGHWTFDTDGGESGDPKGDAGAAKDAAEGDD